MTQPAEQTAFELIWGSNAFWTVVGFAFGLVGSLILERWSRFRAVMDTVCRILLNFDSEMRKCGSRFEFSILADQLFKEPYFELSIQGQFKARTEVGKLNARLSMMAIAVVAEANTTPESNGFLQHVRGNRDHLAMTLLGFRFNEQRDALIAEALGIRPEFFVTLGGHATARWFSTWQEKLKKIAAYMHGESEDWN